MPDRRTNKVEKLSLSHRSIYTEVIINAQPREVWSVLADTESYKNWATFMVDIQGEIKNGNTIKVIFQIDPEKEKFTTIEHRIQVKEDVEFGWSERGPGGIKDNHLLRVESINQGKTRFIQSDELKGGLTWLLGSRFSKMYLEGYQAFNRHLKNEVERRFTK